MLERRRGGLGTAERTLQQRCAQTSGTGGSAALLSLA